MLALLTSYLANTQSAPRVAAVSDQLKTPVCLKPAITPLSPAPDLGSELHMCIGDFLHSRGINVLATETALMELELTPDIISDVPIAQLVEVMCTVEG